MYILFPHFPIPLLTYYTISYHYLTQRFPSLQVSVRCVPHGKIRIHEIRVSHRVRQFLFTNLEKIQKTKKSEKIEWRKKVKYNFKKTPDRKNNNYKNDKYLYISVLWDTQTKKARLSDREIVIRTGFGPGWGGGQLETHREVSR
jgi:hypothetical protein